MMRRLAYVAGAALVLVASIAEAKAAPAPAPTVTARPAVTAPPVATRPPTPLVTVRPIQPTSPARMITPPSSQNKPAFVPPKPPPAAPKFAPYPPSPPQTTVIFTPVVVERPVIDAKDIPLRINGDGTDCDLGDLLEGDDDCRKPIAVAPRPPPKVIAAPSPRQDHGGFLAVLAVCILAIVGLVIWVVCHITARSF